MATEPLSPPPPPSPSRRLQRRWSAPPGSSSATAREAPQVDALRGVDVTFARGSFTAIMGPSGSGKSTLLHILAGLDRPTEGWVEIDGTRLDELDDRALTLLRRRAVGFIFQAYNLLPVLTAEGNITLPLRIGGRKPDREWLEQLIDSVGLADRRDHRPAEMSGGQQQRVAVARALITRPAVVFGDEPTGNLDSVSSREILALMRRAVDELGQTIVMVTHDPSAAAIADRRRVPGRRPARGHARAPGHRRDPRPPAGARHDDPPRAPQHGAAQAARRADRAWRSSSASR